MKMIAAPLALLLVTLACILGADPGYAQMRVFVAAQGSDSNPCSYALPCRTFQRAHDVATANGEINVLDPAGYGALSITKAISIQGHDFSGISVGPSGQGITIVAGPNDRVVLRGLIIDGGGVGATGIAFFSGKSLTIENSVVRNFIGYGIAAVPTAAASILVTNTLVADNANHGIYVRPSGPIGQMSAVFDRVRSYNNGGKGFGVFGDGVPAGSRIIATAVDCIAQNNADGFYALTNGANYISANFSVFRSVAMGNGVFGRGAVIEGGGIMFVGQSWLKDDDWTGCIHSYGGNAVESAACVGGPGSAK